jgi:dethiobiotin synthetase
MNGVFVTGTDTDIGKTVVSAALMAASPQHVHYWKPVQSGTDHDTPNVQELAQVQADRVLDRGVRLQLPASPHHAAAVEGREITLEPLVELARQHCNAGSWVVEGAGGVLVPLSNTLLMPDLIDALNIPALVVTSSRLGTINHTLLTIEALNHRKIPVLGLIMLGPPDEGAITGIQSHTDTPFLAQMDWNPPGNRAQLRALGTSLLVHPCLQSALKLENIQ